MSYINVSYTVFILSQARFRLNSENYIENSLKVISKYILRQIMKCHKQAYRPDLLCEHMGCPNNNFFFVPT